MRILHLINRYWPAVGGAEAYLGEISARLVAEGHLVTVATTDADDFALFWHPRRPRLREAQTNHAGVHIRRFPVRHMPLAPYSYVGWRIMLRLLSASRVVPLSLLYRVCRFTPWVPDLWRWLEMTSETFDLVAGVTILYESIVAAGQRFARRRGVPFVVYPLTHLGAGPRPAADAVSRYYTMCHQTDLVRQSDAIVTLTETERAFYIDQGVPSKRILVAGPGLVPEQILGGDGARWRTRYQLNGPLVAFIGTINYDKGAMHLVEAIRRLWQTGRPVEVALVGSPSDQFQEYWRSLPPAEHKRVRVLGRVDEAEKRDLLAACDIFALPSRTDSFGIVYLEAWLYRKPVVGARAWAIRDVIADGQDGLLVEFGDVPGLALAIARLLDHPEERVAMGANGERKVYRTHLWDQKFALIRGLYTRLTGG